MGTLGGSQLVGARQVSDPNHLLAALPRKEYRRLLPLLEPVKLAFGETLYESQSQIREVYFPNDCFVSMLTTSNSAAGENGDREGRRDRGGLAYSRR